MKRWPKWLQIVVWTVVGIVAVVSLAVAGLAASVALDGRGSSARLDRVANTAIPSVDGGPDVRAYVAMPSGPGPYPAVIMVHEFWGLNPDIVSKADLLASEGYVVVAPDAFRGSSTGYLPRAIYQVVSTPVEQINEDLDSVLAWTRRQPAVDPKRVGITGFCFGGRTSLLFSLHNPTLQATSMFYGQPVTDPSRLKTLRAPVLGVFGGADRSIPLEDVEAFRKALGEAGVEATITVYPGQPHAFVKNAAGIESGGAQGAAWSEMLRFFDGALKSPASSTSSAESDGETRVTDFYGWAPIARLAASHVGHASPWAPEGQMRGEHTGPGAP